MAQKSNAKCCGDVAATLWQRLDNVGERHCHNAGNRRRYNSHFRPFHNVGQEGRASVGSRGGTTPSPEILMQYWSPCKGLKYFLVGNCMFEVNNRNIRTRCEMYSKLTIKHQNGANGVVLVSFLLTLNIFHTLFYYFYC